MDMNTPETGSDFNKKMNQAADNAKDSLKNASDKTKDAVQNAADATSDAMGKAVDKTSDAMKKAGDKIKDMFNKDDHDMLIPERTANTMKKLSLKNGKPVTGHRAANMKTISLPSSTVPSWQRTN